MSFWDDAKESANKAREAAKMTAQKTKLRGEIMLLDREVKNHQKKFGVELYDHVQPLSSTQEFFSSDDLLTTTLRPPLLKAQREIAALEIKQGKVKEKIAQAEVTRKSAFPIPASTWQEKVRNAGKSARMAGNETKLKAELSMILVQVKDHKQKFGQEFFMALRELEDSRGWLPTDRNIRSLYDNTCRDIEDLKAKRNNKEQKIIELGGEPIPDPSMKGRKAVNVKSVSDLSLDDDVSDNMNSASNSSGMFVLSNPSATTETAANSTQAAKASFNVQQPESLSINPLSLPETDTNFSFRDSFPHAESFGENNTEGVHIPADPMPTPDTNDFSCSTSFPDEGSFLGKNNIGGAPVATESVTATVNGSSINADISSILNGVQNTSVSSTTYGFASNKDGDDADLSDLLY